MLCIYDPFDFDKYFISENVDTTIYPMENQYTIELGQFTYRWYGYIAINTPNLN